MRTSIPVRRITSDIPRELTAKVLIGALTKLQTQEIETAIETLIEELDQRSKDPDLEAGADAEADTEEE